MFACSRTWALGSHAHLRHFAIHDMPSSELEWLEHDIGEIRRIIDANDGLLAPLGDLTDVPEHTLRFVTADLFWQIWYHAMAVHSLLREDLKNPLAAVQRALFEAISTLGYLHRHPNRAAEATVLLATTYIRDQLYYFDQPTLVAERTELLARMPEDLVALGRQRLAKHPKTWSGRTVQQLSSGAGVDGYDRLYRILSSHAHAGIVGHHVQLTIDDDGKMNVRTGGGLRLEEVEANANFARRALHDSLKVLLLHLGTSGQIEFHSTDPRLWFNSPQT